MERAKYTLLELSRMIGKAIDDSFPGRYWLAAEINELRENNGHCYLELVEKDKDHDRIIARSRATIWAYTWRMLKTYFETSTSSCLKKGMMILVEVCVEFHEVYGLTLNIKDIDPVYTLGDLERKRAETIRKLEQEGIFGMNRELPFPLLPSRIAVISSPGAAGYEDFIHQINNNPAKYRFRVTLFPAVMQGEFTVSSITGALEAIFENEHLYDVVVILRGGGSASDLSSFDSYEIAAHIAQLPLPVITGIGHERDRMIAGMVANTDLKTPTAVAEFLIGKFGDLDLKISGLSAKLTGGVSRILDQKRQSLNSLQKEVPLSITDNFEKKQRYLRTKGMALSMSATGFIRSNKHKLDSVHSGLGFILKNYLSMLKRHENDIRSRILPGKTKELLRKLHGKLELLNNTMVLVDPENILKKGFALVHKEGRIIKSIREIETGDILDTRLADGRVESRVTGTANNKKAL